MQLCAELIQRKARNAPRAGWSPGARQDGSVRFAALVEKSTDVAVKRLDTHFIDQFGEPPDI
jgi:hypothetical protein